MKNILFITETFLNGGLETRLMGEFQQYKKHNINVFLASGNYLPKYKKYFNTILELDNLPQDIEHIDIKSILKNRDLILNFCRKYSIEFIECHPFWSVVPAVLAAEKLRIPISFTIHGLYSGNFVNHNFVTTQTFVYLILKYGFDQIFAVSEHLKAIYSYLSPNILISRNSLPLNSDIPSSKQSASRKIAIASRLDQPKIRPIIDFLNVIKDSPDIDIIDIYGDGNQKDFLQSFIHDNFPNYKINLLGWEENLSNKCKKENYDAVFGMGRVVLDMITSKIPCGILGYEGFVDFAKPDNIKHFAKTNLTSWDKTNVDLLNLFHDVQTNRNNYLFEKSDLSLFDSNINWQQHYSVLSDTPYKQKPIISKLNSMLENANDNTFNLFDTVDECFRPGFDIGFQFLKEYSEIIKKLRNKIKK